MHDDNHTNAGRQERLGDEAPKPKHFLIVFGVVALLIALAWIVWYKFGWFH